MDNALKDVLGWRDHRAVRGGMELGGQGGYGWRGWGGGESILLMAVFDCGEWV